MIEVGSVQPINIVRIAPRRCDMSTRVDFFKIMEQHGFQQEGDGVIKPDWNNGADRMVKINPISYAQHHELLPKRLSAGLAPVGASQTVFARNR